MYEQVRSGLVSSAAVAVTAAIRGQIELGNALRPVNGISHILWGPQAGKANTISMKYTLTGLALTAEDLSTIQNISSKATKVEIWPSIGLHH